MNQLHLTNRKKGFKQGSALLIAVLVMGILLTLTLGLSDLVIREIRQTSDVVAAGKAYFAAEAAVENALLDLHEQLPGYETPSSGSTSPCDNTNQYYAVRDDQNNPSFDPGHPPCYRILSKADKTYNNVPSFDADKPIFLNGSDVPTNVNFVYTDHPEATFKDLPLSETAVVPLYSATGDSGSPYANVTDFLIEYYVNYQDENLQQQLTSVGINPQELINLDVLRWKIFGRPNASSAPDPAKVHTDAISDFFPADVNASATQPMCIGTDQGLAGSSLNPGGCLFPVFDPGGDSAQQGASGNLWSAARECYLSDSSSQGQLNNIQKACTISDFINSHDQNYLVLTNIINPDVLFPGQSLNNAETKAKLTIHYRVIAKSSGQEGENNPRLVREAASISADGYSANGQVKQSIDVKINQSSFLPVFNFSLYHTKTQ